MNWGPAGASTAMLRADGAHTVGLWHEPSVVATVRVGPEIGVGLLGVHSRYGLHTRAVTVFCDTLTVGFSHFVASMTAPVASGWRVAGWDFHPLESAALSRRTP